MRASLAMDGWLKMAMLSSKIKTLRRNAVSRDESDQHMWGPERAIEQAHHLVSPPTLLLYPSAQPELPTRPKLKEPVPQTQKPLSSSSLFLLSPTLAPE